MNKLSKYVYMEKVFRSLFRMITGLFRNCTSVKCKSSCCEVDLEASANNSNEQNHEAKDKANTTKIFEV